MARFDHRGNNQAILLLILVLMLLALCGCGGGGSTGLEAVPELGPEAHYCPMGGDGVGPLEPASLRDCKGSKG